MNWYKAQSQSPLAYAQFLTWYMHTYPGYSQFEIRGDEEENELVAGFFDVPDSDVVLAETIDPRDLFDFFDSIGFVIKDYPLGPQNFLKRVFIGGFAYSMYSTFRTRKEGEAEAFEWCFEHLQKNANPSTRTFKQQLI